MANPTSEQRDSMFGGRLGNAFNAALGNKRNTQETLNATATDEQNMKHTGNGLVDRLRFAFQAALGGKK